MKRINNKGFTLVEMIIAITILGIVISLGYGIFNTSQKSFNEQSDVFNSQTSINLINKFLSKDLEQSQSISGPLKENEDGTFTSLQGATIDETTTNLQEFIKEKLLKNKSVKYIYQLECVNESSPVDYEINISLSGNGDYNYDINRNIEGKSSIKILSNKTNLKNGNIEIPLIINLEGVTKNSSGIYNVEVSYKDKHKQNKYRFSVKSRIV